MQFEKKLGNEPNVNYDPITLARCKIYIQNYLLEESNLKASRAVICDNLIEADKAFTDEIVFHALCDLSKDGYLQMRKLPIHDQIKQHFLQVEWLEDKRLPPFEDSLFHSDIKLAEFGPNVLPSYEEWPKDFKLPKAIPGTKWIQHEDMYKCVISAPLIKGFSRFGHTMDTLVPNNPADLTELKRFRGNDVSNLHLPSGIDIPYATEGYAWYAIEHGIKLIKKSAIQSIQMKIEREIRFRDSHAQRIGKSQVQDIE